MLNLRHHLWYVVPILGILVVFISGCRTVPRQHPVFTEIRVVDEMGTPVSGASGTWHLFTVKTPEEIASLTCFPLRAETKPSDNNGMIALRPADNVAQNAIQYGWSGGRGWIRLRLAADGHEPRELYFQPHQPPREITLSRSVEQPQD